jgi:methylated-DNA-[protein]-cysteine S-methyltransferase
MAAILERCRSTVREVAVVDRRYAVPGWGVGALWLADGVVLAHEFHFVDAAAASNPTPDAAPLEGAHGPPTGTVAAKWSQDGDGSVPSSREHVSRVADDIVRHFACFLAGDEVDFEGVALDLDWATPLQRSLAETLRAVPRGDVVSYGELAALAGRPGAARAAGAFCAANRFAFVVPCHRVVAANGIGGYGNAGLDVKRRLLALEGVVP